jgi:hypothetical protein
LVTLLTAAEPSLTFVAGASTDQNHISVFTAADGNALVLASYSAQAHDCWMIVDTPAVTAPFAPFAAVAAPPQGAVGATTLVAFLNTQLGPTYAEIKGNNVASATLQVGCNASAPVATNGTTYGTSFTTFPSL